MSKEKSQNFLKGATILTAATILVKLVGVLFSIPLANKIGDEAMGYFNSAYLLFALFNAIATAGLPVAVARMVSSSYALGRRRQANRIFSIASVAFAALGLLCSAAMFFFADAFSNFVNMPGAKASIQALAPTVFFCTVMSAIRGYFQGRSNMVPTAVSQVIESVTKLFVGIALAFYVHDKTGDPTLSSAAAIAGVSISALLGMMFSISYKSRQTNKDKRLGRQKGDSRYCDSGRDIFRTLVRYSVPIAMGSSFIYILDLIDLKMISEGLASLEAFAENYVAVYGTWGNTIKIYDLPGALIIPISTSVLPVLTAAYTRDDMNGVRKTTSDVLRLTMLIAVPCCVGFILYSRPIGQLFYSSEMSINGVARLLPMLSLSVIFVGLLYTTNTVLQSLGNVSRPVIHMILGGVVKIILNYILIRQPSINIAGAAISTTASNFLAIALNLNLIYKFIPGTKNIFILALPTIPSAVLMGGCSYLVFWLLSKVAPSSISLIAAIIVAVLVYFISAIAFRAISPEDIRRLPKGDMLVSKIYKNRRESR